MEDIGTKDDWAAAQRAFILTGVPKGMGVSTENSAHVLTRRGDGVFGNDPLTQAQAKTRLERNNLTALARLGNIQDFHKS